MKLVIFRRTVLLAFFFVLFHSDKTFINSETEISLMLLDPMNNIGSGSIFNAF